jgi:cellobiuronic acid synthase
LFTFILQLRDTLQHGHPLHLFTMFVATIWTLWAIKVLLSRRYRPWTVPYRPTVSVVIPVVDEPLELFRRVVRLIAEQQPDETIVVINGPRNPALESICNEVAGCLHWTWTPVAGKRNAVRIGVETARGEVVVLVDSDTIWTPGTLTELLKPFADPGVGGVTTKQRILDHERNLLTRWADWLENSRALYAMPAQSVLGQVGCLPGRTIAFRREILVRAMPAFMRERFLGVFLEISDDRTLTNYTLMQGYRTVFQATSLVYTDTPTRLGKLAKQQYRWARGSQYNSLRMLSWMLTHAPVLALFFVADMVMPFLLLGTVTGWTYRRITGTGTNLYEGYLVAYGWWHGLAAVVTLSLAASSLSMAIRHQRHLHERPNDLIRLPIFVLISTFFLMPIRLYGFFRMAHAGNWGTRQHAYMASRPSLVGAGPQVDPEHGYDLHVPRHNQWALLPVLLGLLLFLGGVLYDH